MAEKIGEAYVEVRADTDEMESGLRSSFGRIAGVAAAAFAGGQISQFTGSVISAASDMGETISKVGVIFGDNAADIESWAATAAARLGQSSQAAMNAAATFATFGKSAGLTGGDLSGFSTTLGDLASDLASFHNTSPEAAVAALGAALRGESEPMRAYGVLLDDATLRNRALALGLIATTKDALTPQNKVLAAQAEILAQTGDAQGDFARTSDGLANKQRILAAQFADIKVKLGTVLLPIAKEVVTFLSNHMGPAFDGVRAAVSMFMGGLNGETGEGEGLLRFFAALGEQASVVKDWLVENWPQIRAVVAEVAAGVGVALGFLTGEVLPRVVDAVATVVGFVQANWPTIQATIAAVVAWIGENVVPVVAAVADYAIAKFGELTAWVQANWPTIQATIAAVVERVREIVAAVTAAISAVWRNWGDTLLQIAQTVFGSIRATIENAVNLVREVIQTLMAVIRGDWSAAWDGVKGIAAAIWDQIVNVASTAGALLAAGLAAIWIGVKLAASAAWDGIKVAVSAAVDGLVEYVSGLPARLGRFAGDLGSAALGIGGAIVRGLKDGLSGVADAISAPFRAGWNAVARWWNANVGNLNFAIPGWVPGIGGQGFDMPNLPTFHRGGVMPGGPGTEGVALLRGGETVFTEDQLSMLARFGLGTRTGPAVAVENAYFASDLDVEAFSAMAGFVLGGVSAGAGS